MSLSHGKDTFQSDDTPWSHITIIDDDCNMPVRRRNSIDVGRACQAGARVRVPLLGDLWGLFLALQH